MILAWDNPGANRVVIGEIGAGSELELLQRTGDWARVRGGDGMTGWVEARSLQRLHRTAARSRWFAAVAAALVLGLVIGGILIFARTHSPQTASGGSPGFTGSPSTSALLADAYANGRIDRPTWVQYRAYAMFGDERLPAQYRSNASSESDEALAAELQLGDPLPADVRSQVTSLLSRPASPGSVFYGSGVAATGAVTGSRAVLADTVTCGPSNWTSKASKLAAFRVWTRCTPDFETRLNTIVNLLEGLWLPMTTLMGDPLSDADPGADPSSYGGDSDLDIYLVPRDTDITRGGGTVRIDGLTAAVAVAAAPFTGNRSSGYMLVDEHATQEPGLRATLAHEFFHILEYARNYRAHWDRVRLHMEENWFAEASAVWAQGYFAPSSAVQEVYPKAIQFLQHPALSIDARGPTGSDVWHHEYEAFLWLYFMQQERGPGVVGTIWNSQPMLEATDGAGATAAFDLVFPFGDHFSDFALRNLNDPAMKPVAGRLYQDLDPKFPTTPQDEHPVVPARSGSMFVKPQNAGDPPATQLSVNVDHLSAQYFDVTFDSTVDQVTLDLSGLTAPQHVQVNLVVLPLASAPTPMLVSVPLQSSPPPLCNVTKIERAILVVSNGDLHAAASGTIAAKGTTDSCTQTPSGGTKVTVTGVSPSQLVANNSAVTLKISGSGFTALQRDSIDVLFAPALVTYVPGGNTNGARLTDTVVSDTELDATFQLAPNNMAGTYDLTVQGTDAQGDVIGGTCTGCLTVSGS